MPLRFAYEKLGKVNCKALLGFHALTGCDQTGKFYGFSKLSCWKTFNSSSPEVYIALQSLGNTLHTDTINNLVIFVLNLYYKNRPKSINDLGGLRWYLFTKYQYESSKLPPTKKAFEQMVLRAHYTCLQWKSSHIPSPQLPNPNDFSWNWNQDDKIYEPLMTTNPHAPDPSSNLVYVVARLLVKVEDVSVTKTICYVSEMYQMYQLYNVL